MKYFNNLLKNTSGFSIVELGVVIIIGALMTIPIYTLLFYVTELKPTDERIEIVQEALAEHLRVTGTLPCPADPALDIDTNANAYVGGTFDSATNTCPTAGTAIQLSNDVYIGALPVRNLKVAVDCASNNGEISGTFVDALKDNLYSVRELIVGRKAEKDLSGAAVESIKADGLRCPQNEYILNAEGQKFIYAVSRTALAEGFDLFDPAAGRVVIQNEAGNPIDNNRLYALVSLGADGKGGYDRHGRLVAGGCTPGDLDSENCNNDNVFVSAPKNESSVAYYDDTVEYGIARFIKSNSFWRWDNDSTNQTNTVLGDNVALVIDPTDTTTNSEYAINPVSGFDVNSEDSLVVNRGKLLVQGDMQVHAQTYANANTGSNDVAGGELVSNSAVTAKNVNASKIALAPKYCYPDALSDACETSQDGLSGHSCVHGVKENTACCDPNDGDAQCCPIDVFNGNGQCSPYWTGNGS